MQQESKKTTQKSNFNVIFPLVIVFLLGVASVIAYLKDYSDTIDRGYFEHLIETTQIREARLDDTYLFVKTNEGNFKILKEAIDLKEVANKIPITKTKAMGFGDIIDLALLLILVFGVYVLFRAAKKTAEIKTQPIEQKINIQTSAVGNEDAGMRILPSVSKIRFKDVAGVSEVKEELEEIIDFLRNPKKYTDFGISLPRGVLLVGPPGVGKTMIAKAVAGEAGVPFFYMSGSSFVHMYVGVGAKRVRELFAKAKSKSPSIIFIDEIDAVGKARGGFRNDEREATLNQLLTEMDGFEDSSGVIVIGATNKIDMLDHALLRSGRFDRRVFVSLPTPEERVEIFRIYLKGKQCNVDIEHLAKITVGFSGAGIASFVNEAALSALKRGAHAIELEDFTGVKEKVASGKKKAVSLNDEERRILATYQAAKAVSAYWFDFDFDKISLMNDGIKEFEREILGKSDLIAKIKLSLAGNAAVENSYGQTYTNSGDDLDKAKALSLEMVERYGMGELVFGSQNDANKIIENALKEMKEFLLGHKELLKKVEERLLEKEVVNKIEMKAMVDEIF